mgnify:FL=1
MDQIKEHFEKNHGNVNLYPLYGDNIDYFAIFQKRDDGLKFREELVKKEGENIGNERPKRPCFNKNHIILVKVGEGDATASLFIKTYEKYEEKVRNDIKSNF